MIGMVLMPFSSGTEVAVVAYGLPVLLLLCIGYIVLQMRDPYFRPGMMQPSLLGLLLVITIVATSLYGPEFKAAAARVIPNVIGFLVFLYLLSPFSGPPGTVTKVERTAAIYIVAATVVALYYLINFVVQANEVGLAGVLLDRVTGGIISLPWGATNVVASLLLLPMLLTFYFGSKTDNTRGGFFYLFARTIMVATILLTQSRGAMISGAFGLVLLAFFFKGRARIRLLAFVALTWFLWAMFDSWVQSVLDQQFVSEIVARFSGEDVVDLNGRVQIWEKFSDAFLGSPLLGSGFYSTLYTIGSSGHNIVLTTVVERGLVGLALSSAILIKAAQGVVSGFFRAKASDLKLFLACLGAGGAASVLHLMVEDANFTQQYIVYSWVALALVFQVLEALPAEAPVAIRDAGHNSLRYTT